MPLPTKPSANWVGSLRPIEQTFKEVLDAKLARRKQGKA